MPIVLPSWPLQLRRDRAAFFARLTRTVKLAVAVVTMVTNVSVSEPWQAPAIRHPSDWLGTEAAGSNDIIPASTTRGPRVLQIPIQVQKLDQSSAVHCGAYFLAGTRVLNSHPRW